MRAPVQSHFSAAAARCVVFSVCVLFTWALDPVSRWLQHAYGVQAWLIARHLGLTNVTAELIADIGPIPMVVMGVLVGIVLAVLLYPPNTELQRMPDAAHRNQDDDSGRGRTPCPHDCLLPPDPDPLPVGEGESSAASWRPSAHGLAASREAFLPLPEGEGGARGNQTLGSWGARSWSSAQERGPEDPMALSHRQLQASSFAVGR